MRHMSDWEPTANWKHLKLRASILRNIRAFFDKNGFIEVETPLLSADTVIDQHLDPIGVVLPDDPRTALRGRAMWLQTSPEFSMKRLMAADGTAIYQITRAFRMAERGPLHNPEFTIAEWYRRDDKMDAGMQLLADLCESILRRGPAERLTYREAFQQHVGIDPHTTTVAELAATAHRYGISVPQGFSNNSSRASDTTAHRDAWLDFLLSELVAPRLGNAAPTILHDYPASQAMLSRVREDTPPVAERFELFVDGIELANGYHELLDADELLRRNRQINELRAADGKPPLTEETRLLEAMRSGMPPCTGCALGVDRLVMVATGASSIDEVLAFPIERA